MTENQQRNMYGSLFALNSLLQLSGASTASSIARRESKLQQKKIDVENTAREANRKEMLAEALAATNAMSGTKGIMALEGSPLTVMKQMERSVDNASQQDSFMTDLEKTTAKYRAKQKKVGYQSQAAQSLLTSGLGLMESL